MGTYNWYEQSSTCVPIPTGHASLLAPIRNSRICPLFDERFELRTATFGCGCSTLTLLTSIITVLCTVAGFLLLWGLFSVISKSITWTRGTRGGWMIRLEDDGPRRRGQIWVRKATKWRLWWNKKAEEDISEIDHRRGHRTSGLSKWWHGRKRHGEAEDQRRALLR